MLRRDELADDDADERVADAQPQPGEHEGDRPGERDGPEELQVRRTEGARDLDEVRVEVPHAGRGVDDDREERAEEDDGDLRPDADPEPDDEEREQDDARRGVEERDERIDGVGEAPVPADAEAEQDPHDDGEDVADGELLKAHRNVLRELPTLDEVAEREDHLARHGEEQRRRDRELEPAEHDALRPGGPDEPEGLPEHEERRDADRPDDLRLVPLEPRVRLGHREHRRGLDDRTRARRHARRGAIGDGHQATLSSMSFERITSSRMLSQILSSYSRNRGSRLMRRSRGRGSPMGTLIFTRPGRAVKTITRSAR